ncbi:hypothetical protein KCP69_01865 [Salmonella enterica subsp. enterica]|nr:hypothetical protein KCP69_01865 [Salmonella enterica subsp. enterica]
MTRDIDGLEKDIRLGLKKSRRYRQHRHRHGRRYVLPLDKQVGIVAGLLPR